MPVPRALTADLWGTWICRETFYASVERAPQGPLRALGGTWMVRGAFYADRSAGV